MKSRNEINIDYLITRFQQSIFSLVLYLIGGDKNATYDITVLCFVKAIQTTSLHEEGLFFAKLVATAVEKSRGVKAMPTADESDFLDLPAEKRKALQMTKTALYALTFEAKAQLLLRDQLHLPYKVIAATLKMPEQNVRVETNTARVQLRERIEEVLRNAR